jgi:hypothetical protein
MKAAFLVATAVSLASMASAAVSPVFIGCYYPGLADNLIANLISGVANTLTFTTAASCAVSQSA